MYTKEECALGRSLGCSGLNTDNTCKIYNNEGVLLRMNQGVCIFKNIRAPKAGIYAPKAGRKINPLKAAKAEARNAAVQA